MSTQGYSIREKMVLFLHNHFVSEYNTVQIPQLMYLQNKLFRQYADRIIRLGGKKIANEDIPSPDRSKILSKRIWKTRRPIFFLPDEPEYRQDAYLISVRCSERVEKQVLKPRYGNFARWYVQWSPDGTFVIFIDYLGPFENNNKLYILR